MEEEKVVLNKFKKGIELLYTHDDADGISSAVLLAHAFPVKNINCPEDFGEWEAKEDLSKNYKPPDVATDMIPKDPNWLGICIDHHPNHHPVEVRKYTLVWDSIPTTGIVYKLFKDQIPEEYRWKVAIGLCVHGNTSIATLKGSIPASKIKVGERLWAWTGKNFAETRVISISERRVDTLIELTFRYKNMKRKLLVTKEHPILLSSGKWKTAEEIKVGEEVRFLDSSTYQNIMGISKKISEINKRIFSDPSKRNLQSVLRNRQPSILEERILKLAENKKIPIKFVGNGKLITKAGYCPAFQVIGQPEKIIELSRSHYKTDKYMLRKIQSYKAEGYKCLLIYMTPNLPEDEQLERMLWSFISNGLKLVGKREIKAKMSSKHIQKFKVYNFHCEPYNNYVAQSIVVHNCGDGQPELIPPEIWKGCPALLDMYSVPYERYGRITFSKIPVFLKLSSMVNAPCKIPEKWYTSYQVLKSAKEPLDVLEDPALKAAKESVDDEERRIFKESRPIELPHFRVWEISSDYKIERSLGWKSEETDKKTTIVVNSKTGRISLRGVLSLIVYEELKKMNYNINGHPGFGGGKLRKDQNVEQLIRDLRKIKII